MLLVVSEKVYSTGSVIRYRCLIIDEDFIKRSRSTLGEEGRPLLDDYKKGKKIIDLQYILCGDISTDSNSYLESRGSIKDFVSFREMITSQLLYLRRKFKQTNLFAEAISSIPGIVDTYLAIKMNEAIKTAVQLQSDRLKDEALAENEDFINKLDENIKKIIKEQVKVQVKEQISKILLRIEKLVNEQLEAEVMTHSSNKAKTSHAVAANLYELKLKKILIDKMESNKSIHRSVQQKTLYKALVKAYETNKVILKTYGDTVMFKRPRDDEDEDKEPFGGTNQGSKRRRSGKELESTSAPKVKTSKSTNSSKEGSTLKARSTDMSAQAEEDVHANKDLEEPTH
nr:hypothetical protein [Tanacetum cinerariifolium]